jgi:hypothetical protein
VYFRTNPVLSSSSACLGIFSRRQRAAASLRVSGGQSGASVEDTQIITLVRRLKHLMHLTPALAARWFGCPETPCASKVTTLQS